jgi:KUP system potassium uptake protein
VPWINWLLLAAVLTLVVAFKSSAALAYAFGMAVTGTITITTLLFFYIARTYWRTPLWIVVPGAAFLLTVDLLFFAANLTKQVLHEHVLILAIETMPVPHIPAAERITVDDLGYPDDRIVHVTACFGYMDQQDIPSLLPLIRKADIESPLDDDKLSYFLSRIELARGNAPGMSRWRKRLFVATSRITADAAEYFQLPRERTLVMGSRIEL